MIFVSAVTFTIHSVAVGMILRELKTSLTTYFARPIVIGLAVGFGTQGFLSDLVTDLTFILSDALAIAQLVKLADDKSSV